MQPFYFFDMDFEFWYHTIGQHSNPVFSAFAIPDGDLFVAKINILNSKSKSFRNS